MTAVKGALVVFNSAGASLGRRRLTATVLLILMLLGGLAAVVFGSQPREVPVSTIAELASRGEVRSLHYSDDMTLFAETSTAGELRSRNVRMEAAVRLSINNGIGLTMGGYSPQWLGTLVLLIPPLTAVAIALLAIALFFWLRRGRTFARSG